MKELLVKNLALLPKRSKEGHKYTYGSLLIIGGSIGYLGAPELSGLAALRSGVGLASIALPNDIYYSFKKDVLSLMFFPYQTSSDIKALLPKKTAVVFGPGLNKDDPQNEAVLETLLTAKIALLIDASGLDIFKRVMDKFDDFANVVITPHLGEAARLLDGLDPLTNYELLLKKNITLVLKGSTTIIAKNNERFLANNGHPAMAVAGMGDVLSGVIGAFLAEGYSPLEASKLGVYIHQAAARYALKATHEISLISEDVINSLPFVYDELTAEQK